MQFSKMPTGSQITGQLHPCPGHSWVSVRLDNFAETRDLLSVGSQVASFIPTVSMASSGSYRLDFVVVRKPLRLVAGGDRRTAGIVVH